MEAAKFIKTWKDRPGNEIGNAQSFLNDLCDLLKVPRPHAEKHSDHREYGFERPVTFYHANGATSPGRIDLYRRGCFVLEAKQGSEQKARIAGPKQHELTTGEKISQAPRGMAQRNTQAYAQVRH